MRTGTQQPIAYDAIGDGEPAVLFLPGWCGHRTVFRGTLAALGQHRRALALDWRGHGGSAPAAGDYTTADLVDDAVAVIEGSGAAAVVLAAAAHAGWVAIELRRRLGPERVPAVVLLDWMVLGPPPPFLDALAGLQDPSAWEPVRAGLFAMWTTGVDLPALDSTIAEMATHGFDDWARGGREIAAAFAAHGSPVAALAELAAAGAPCPTLHLYAQPSDDAFLLAQRDYAAANPWFSVQRLDAKSHFPTLEAPDVVADVIDTFAAEHA